MTCTICIVILFVGQNPGCIGRSLLQRDNPIKKKKKKLEQHQLDFFQTWCRENAWDGQHVGPMPIYFLFDLKNGDMAAIFVF